MARVPMTFASRSWQLDVSREMIDVTSERPSPNERWTFIDSNGHEHRYDHGYKTLELVVDESHWCDGHEGLYNHDPHEVIDEAHYECRICREVIEPTMDPPYTPKSVLGSWDARLTGYRSDGARVEVWITEDELGRFTSDPTDEEVAAFLDGMGDDRILSVTFASR